MPHLPPIMQVIPIAVEAGRRIMAYYNGEKKIEIKEDASPVTIADKEANDIIAGRLMALTPNIPVISEENEESDNERARIAGRFWLVDPLDGTKSFIKQTGEFTVNIALIDNQRPVLGVIYVPGQDLLYYTGDDGSAYKATSDSLPGTAISVRKQPAAGATVVASASHRTPETDAFIATLKVDKLVSASSSIKLCLVAEGAADVYPRFGRTMEWDIGAGHAILLAAGGALTNTDGSAFLYGKKGLDNGYFVARGE